ncbi:hypothetical protein DM860_010401 [Cuscuta australis]|uniref:Uncharacterized protein n=1 Tax=Cuscuta australis TaxID=267555 RepID=A0A328E5F0_9ASTE|nr:hypothetical protein DM860_010401 [Cuscuta australis]
MSETPFLVPSRVQKVLGRFKSRKTDQLQFVLCRRQPDLRQWLIFQIESGTLKNKVVFKLKIKTDSTSVPVSNRHFNFLLDLIDFSFLAQLEVKEVENLLETIRGKVVKS